MRGMVQRLGVRGQALMQRRQLKEASAALQLAFSTMREVDVHACGEDELGVCHQFALLNMADCAIAFQVCVREEK